MKHEIFIIYHFPMYQTIYFVLHYDPKIPKIRQLKFSHQKTYQCWVKIENKG